MSLLLEALKKAELAKQSADTNSAEPKSGAGTVITRDTLPDISQPLEIRANDLPSAGARAGETPFGPAPVDVLTQHVSSREEAATSAPFNTAYGGMTPPVEEASEAVDGQRAVARQMFEAKEIDLPNPKRNFYITLGALGVFAAGYGGYVWWQLQPRSLYNAAAVAKKGGEAPPPNAPPPPAPVAAAPADAAPPVASTTTASPASPAASAPAPVQAPPGGAAKAATSPTVASTTPAAATSRTPDVAATPPASRPAAMRSSPVPRPSEPRNATGPIAVTPSTSVVNPQIERGYDAFQQGDLAGARNQYQLALQRDATNRDALLGLAAIDIRTRNYELAESRYLRLLETDPRDAYAMAGLIALRGQTDPLQTESRLKSLIAGQPDVAHLHFALGNQYAAQSRWTEAQTSFFKAFSLDPENPDFAFNLVVSLDQLRQAKLALDYYRRALALAGARPTSFEKNQVTARITELSR